MMPYDFDRINDDYPVRDVLHRLGVRVRGSSYACPICGDGQNSDSGSLYHDQKTGRERGRCHGKCDKSYDSVDLAKWASGAADVAGAVEWLTGQKVPNGHRTPPNDHPRKRETPKPHDYGYFPPDQRALFKIGLVTPPMVNDRGGKIWPFTPSLVHLYSDGKGIRLIAVRYVKEDGRKSFFPVRWSPTRGLISTSWQEGEEKLFYRQTDLADHPDKTVLVLEGEKCVDLVRGLAEFADEYVAITWQGGSGTAKYQPWEQLRGRRVLFWPDADPPKANDELGKSERAMRTAAKLAGASVMQIVIPLQEWVEAVYPNGKSKGFDIADLLETMPAAEARALMESLAEPIEPEPEPKAKEPPPEPPPENEGEGPGPRWVLKPVTADGGITWVLDTRDENNIWVQLTELDPPKGYRGRFSRDVFTNAVMLDGKLLDEGHGPHTISHEMALSRILRGITPEKVRARIGDYASMRPVNPLADELRALPWDGQLRSLLDYAGVVSTPWSRAAGWRWLLGLVRRILEPGSQHDGVLVLEGLQGTRKTSFFRTVGTILGRDLFVEIDKLTREPDTLMILQGKAVVELAEMTAHRRGDANAVKSMLSSTSDKYRIPYGRKPEDVKRTCVFGGTTNDRKYLKDPTGNRRYWIVRVAAPMSLDALAADLPQLLAQAVHYLTHPDPANPSDSWNWLTPEEERMQEEIARERLIDWPQFDKLDYELDRLPPGDTIERYEIWTKLGFTSAPPSNSDLSQQLSILMEERGWPYKQHHRYTGTQRHNRWSWRKPTPPDTPDP